MSDKPEEKKEAAPAAEPVAGGEAKGIAPGMFFGVIGGMVVLMLGGVFAMYKFMILPTLEKVSAPHTASAAEGSHSEGEHAAPEEKGGHGDAKKDSGHGDAKKEEKADAHGGGGHGGGSSSASSTKPMGEFILTEIKVNVAGTRAGRVLAASLSFHGTPDVIAELDGSSAKVRDLVIQILSRKTMDELTGPSAYGMIRSEIITNINALLTEGKVDSVSFTDFIIQ